MIFIRADANEKIGTGHIMRCLSLGQAFASKNQEVIFITADHRGDTLVQNKGFRSICLNSDWTNMGDEPLVDLITEKNPDLVLVDSYFATENYLHSIRNSVITAYMDDMNAACWDVDYLINYNIFARKTDYSLYKNKNTELLLGPSFAPLRKEFEGLPHHEIKENITDILVSAGGADPDGITLLFLHEICPHLPGVRFHFVVGVLNPRIQEIKASAPANVVLHINEQHMSELMTSCDIAVSAAGSTLYELCACGIPSITYSLADNQIVAARQFQEQNVMINAGDCRNNRDFTGNIESCIHHLSEDFQLRKTLSAEMQKLVDGHGANRIAERLLQEI